MKKILLVFIAALLCGCQPIERLPAEQRQHVTVHEVAGKDRTAIFNAARAWFATAFRDSKAVLEVQDKDTGQLMGKGVLPNVLSLSGGGVRVMIHVDIKDGKYRATIEPLQFVSSSGYERSLEQYELGDALTGCKRLDDELAAFIAKPSADF